MVSSKSYTAPKNVDRTRVTEVWPSFDQAQTSPHLLLRIHVHERSLGQRIDPAALLPSFLVQTRGDVIPMLGWNKENGKRQEINTD